MIRGPFPAHAAEAQIETRHNAYSALCLVSYFLVYLPTCFLYCKYPTFISSK
jgi:hypothetical protein